jgi:hypothetical protein
MTSLVVTGGWWVVADLAECALRRHVAPDGGEERGERKHALVPQRHFARQRRCNHHTTHQKPPTHIHNAQHILCTDGVPTASSLAVCLWRSSHARLEGEGAVVRPTRVLHSRTEAEAS